MELLDRLKRVRLHVAYRFSVGLVGGVGDLILSLHIICFI